MERARALPITAEEVAALREEALAVRGMRFGHFLWVGGCCRFLAHVLAPTSLCVPSAGGTTSPKHCGGDWWNLDDASDRT